VGKVTTCPKAPQFAADIIRRFGPVYRDLMAMGMPKQTIRLVEELFWWTWAAKAIRPLRQMQKAAGPKTEVMSAMVAAEIAFYEEVLGSGWTSGRYSSIERDPRFGDRVIEIYRSLVPMMPASPRRPPAVRSEPVVFSRPAARMTADLINMRVAGLLAVSLTERDVLRRVQARH
jgi:hypothetical protein